MVESGEVIKALDLSPKWVEATEQQRERLWTDIGKYAVITSVLEKRIEELSGARAVRRFFFRHIQWRDDRYWVHRYRSDQFEIGSLSSQAQRTMEGKGHYAFYATNRDISSLDLITNDAFNFGQKQPELYNAVDMESEFPGIIQTTLEQGQ